MLAADWCEQLSDSQMRVCIRKSAWDFLLPEGQDQPLLEAVSGVIRNLIHTFK